tara:strand:- start:759 stop:983 length:225 start_codon:yes stop_codon:yes gene_type:complete
MTTNEIYILEININNQLNRAYFDNNKKDLLKQINENEEYDDEYYIIYSYDSYNDIKILFENKSISKIKNFLSNN